MNPSLKRAHHLGHWLSGIIILIAFGLVDAAVVALPAMVVTCTSCWQVQSHLC
jgi:hypothetical protein